MSVNMIVLLGNLGKDPELRTTDSGTTIAKMSLATTARVKKQGEWVDETTWHNLVCFGRTAENAGKYLRKGRQVHVVGRQNHRSFEKNDGTKAYFSEVIVNELTFVGGKGDSDGGDSYDRGSSGGGGGGRGNQRDNGGYRGGGDSSRDTGSSGQVPYADDDVPF